MFNKSRALLLRIISEGKPIYNFRIKIQEIAIQNCLINTFGESFRIAYSQFNTKFIIVSP